MPSVPKATTLATATAVSFESALMAGAAAVIAVTPQIEVPAASRDPSLLLRPARFAAQGMNVRPAVILAVTTGMPTAPSFATSTRESLAPTQTMPVVAAAAAAVVVVG